MHPAIRILCFLAFMVFTARADFIFLSVALFVFFLLAMRGLSSIIKHAWHFVYRLRWFWLSIILLYAFMTPGEVLLSLSSSVYISLQGLINGVERCLSLLTVLLYFSLLAYHTSAEQWPGAIYWIIKPLEVTGLSVRQLSLRLSLTMQAVSQLQTGLKKQREQQPEKGRWRQLPEKLAGAFNHALQQAHTQSVNDFEFEYQAPALWQWIYPVSLVACLIAMNFMLRQI